jgi:hypothetical protein
MAATQTCQTSRRRRRRRRRRSWKRRRRRRRRRSWSWVPELAPSRSRLLAIASGRMGPR